MRVFIEPFQKNYLQNRLFDLSDAKLNRDGGLEPYARARDNLAKRGIEILTSDFFNKQIDRMSPLISLGPMPAVQEGLERKSLVVMEPPVVAPKFYRDLVREGSSFKKVFLHNIDGDGFDLPKTTVEKFYWPMPKNKEHELWHNENRQLAVLMINGKHRPGSMHRELYSERLRVLALLEKSIQVEFFGRGWDQWLTRSTLWWPHLQHAGFIRRNYRGACDSKFSTLSQYWYCLCFENMEMRGYITEKIFDCFYSGVIPIYRGASDVESYIPRDCFIDYRQFGNTIELAEFLKGLSITDRLRYREAGRAFLHSPDFAKFYNSIENIILQSIQTH